MIRIFTIIVVLTSMCFAQRADNLKKEQLISGEDIIRKAKETAGLSLPTTSPKTSFQIKLHRFAHLKLQGIESINDSQDEIVVLSLNKIRVLSVYKDGGLTKQIWNETKFKQTAEFDGSDGTRQVVDTTNGIQLGQNVLNAIKSKNATGKSLDSKAAIFSSSLWGLVFPFILTHPTEPSAKFEYLGRAKAGEQIANVVQTTSINGHTIQLFFDEKTSNILLLIEKYKKTGKDFEIKYYYSNREKRNEILVPTKVKIEHKVTPTGQTPVILFHYIDLVDFEVNPTINPEIFKIN